MTTAQLAVSLNRTIPTTVGFCNTKSTAQADGDAKSPLDGFPLGFQPDFGGAAETETDESLTNTQRLRRMLNGMLMLMLSVVILARLTSDHGALGGLLF